MIDCIAVIIDFSSLYLNVDGRNRFINQSNMGSAKMSDIRKFMQKKWKVNTILRKESRIMSIECKTLCQCMGCSYETDCSE